MNSSVPPMVETRRLFQPPVQSRSAIRCRAFIYLLVFACLLSQFLLNSFQWARLIGIRALEAADISYLFDEIGRLRAVVDPGSDTAVYNYDAVGNLLSITRQSTSVVSIIEFTPDSGPVGMTVTIFGTGFSATPSQNTVTFNGVSASVTSSTATQIVTSVPAGATTGVIGVTAPGGSASSTQVFTVTESTGAPTITGFSPAIGTPGTAVTVTGTNFETVLNRNSLRLNVTPSSVSSAAVTNLNATVPTATGSGRFTLTTPHGQAVSTDDFFIPPSPYTAADVAYTGRMAIGGGTHTATISTANKVGLVVFDGSAGQQASLGVNSITMSTSSDIFVYNPDGSTLASSGLLNTSTNFHMTLPATGTYSILIDPDQISTGSVTLTLSSEVAVGVLTINDAAVPVTISRVGQRARATFSGTSGQQVTARVTGNTMGSVNVQMLKPDGTQQTSSTSSASSFNTATQTLGVTGTYTILVDPASTNTGSLNLSVTSP